MANTSVEERLKNLESQNHQLVAELQHLQVRCEHLEERARLSADMLRATNAINSSLSFSEVVGHILDSVERLLQVKRAAIMLLDPAHDDLRIVGARGLSREKIKSLAFKRGEGCAGWVLEHGESLLIPDVSEDERFMSLDGSDRRAESIAVVPLLGQGEVKGVLSVDRPCHPHPLEEDDLTYLEVLADHASVALQNARMHEDLLQRASQLSTLYEVGSALASVLNVDRLLSLIVDSVVRVTGAQICSLMLLDSDRRTLRIRVARGLSEEMVRDVRIPVGQGISGYVAQTGQPLLIKDIENHPLFGKKSSRKYSSNSLLSVPLVIKGEVIGVLNVNNKVPHGPFTEDDQNLLILFASHAAVTIENANLYEHLERLAITDGLTGLYVHRHFLERLEQELQRAKRFNRPISVVMLDIDRFKNFNDTYGHQVGDEVLKVVADILRRNGSRDQDILGRYGGEEFVIALVEANKETAVMVAERVRHAIETHPLDVEGEKITITISAGVASCPSDAETRGDLVRMADECLYNSKETGRNRVSYRDDAGEFVIETPQTDGSS